MNPAISVILPVWNGEAYLAEAVESILAQTFENFELIVVDDGSSDRTPEILAGYPDARLRVLRLNHGGIVTALNHGVANARADWVARQDADDISAADRLEKQWKAVTAQLGAKLCHTAVDIIGSARSEIRKPRFPKSKAMVALRMCFQCPIVHSTVLFEKKAFLAAGGYRAEERHAEDFGAWGRLLELGDIIGLPESLLEFRIHTESVSNKNLDVQNSLTRKIAISHCARYMQLDARDAERAFDVLNARRTAPAADWWWFLMSAATRMRWQSFEMWSWLVIQALKNGLSRRRGASDSPR